jgi:PAS domain-containing protein
VAQGRHQLPGRLFRRPIIVGDEVRGAVVSFTDATSATGREREMRESEEQFRALAENAAAADPRHRHDDTIVFANPPPTACSATARTS